MSTKTRQDEASRIKRERTSDRFGKQYINIGREIDNCAIDLEREKSLLLFLFVSERRSSRRLVV